MVVILSGPVRAGKTTWLAASLARWAARGEAVSGFLSLAVTDEGGRTGYDLLELESGLRHPYLRRGGEPGAERVGPYAFDPGALERARRLIRDAAPERLLVVDEFGPLELAGRGLWPALAPVVADARRQLLLVVREAILEDVLARLGPAAGRVFGLGEAGLAERLDAELFRSGEAR